MGVVDERVDFDVHANRVSGACGAEEAVPAPVVAGVRFGLGKRQRPAGPHVSGIRCCCGVFEGVQVEIDAADQRIATLE